MNRRFRPSIELLPILVMPAPQSAPVHFHAPGAVLAPPVILKEPLLMQVGPVYIVPLKPPVMT